MSYLGSKFDRFKLCNISKSEVIIAINKGKKLTRIDKISNNYGKKFTFTSLFNDPVNKGINYKIKPYSAGHNDQKTPHKHPNLPSLRVDDRQFYESTRVIFAQDLSKEGICPFYLLFIRAPPGDRKKRPKIDVVPGKD